MFIKGDEKMEIIHNDENITIVNNFLDQETLDNCLLYTSDAADDW